MSSEIEFDSEEMDVDFQELLEADEIPEGAFYLALRNALAQLEQQTTWG